MVTHTASEEINVIEMLQQAIEVLLSESRFVEALEAHERKLVLEQRVFGPESEEVKISCQSAADVCNTICMQHLQSGDLNSAKEVLKKAKVLTLRDPARAALVHSNFAVLYRQQGHLHSAVFSLLKALELERNYPDSSHIAETHLNLSVVYSQLGKYETALEHAQEAARLSVDSLNLSRSSGKSTKSDLVSKPDGIAIVALSYHSLGVCYEYLKQYTASLQSYTKGFEIASQYLGSDHGITLTLQKSQLAAAKSIEKAKKKLEAAKTVEGAINTNTHSSKPAAKR